MAVQVGGTDQASMMDRARGSAGWLGSYTAHDGGVHAKVCLVIEQNQLSTRLP